MNQAWWQKVRSEEEGLNSVGDIVSAAIQQIIRYEWTSPIAPTGWGTNWFYSPLWPSYETCNCFWYEGNVIVCISHRLYSELNKLEGPRERGSHGCLSPIACLLLVKIVIFILALCDHGSPCLILRQFDASTPANVKSMRNALPTMQ